MSETKTPEAAKKPPRADMVQAESRATLRKLFDQQKPELTLLLPKSMSAERLYRIALSECLKNPKLLECSMQSWALAMQTCAAQGLYPDSGLGYMYLIPSNNSKKIGNEWKKVMEVRAQRGYQGDIKLVRNSGELADIWAEVVFDRDEFVVKKGLDRDISHKPYYGDEDPGALRFAYAVAKMRDGSLSWVVLTKRDVMRHKAASQGADEDASPWKKHPESMWKKSAIRELYKFLPKDTERAEEVAVAIATDGTPGLPGGPALDIAAIESAELPQAPEASKNVLDRVADEAGHETAPACAHAKIEEHLKTAKRATVCPDCGEEVPPLPQPAPEECKHPLISKAAIQSLTREEWQTCPECKERVTNPEAP